jgi:hypothetical protein
MENTAAITAVRDIAKSIAPDQVIGTLSTDLEEIGYGSTFNLTGTFKLPDKTPVPALNVRFEIKNSSDNNWRTLSAGVTDLAGVIAVPVILGQKSQIRLVSEGSWERTEGKTVEKVISVVPNVSLSLPASIKVATSYTVYGQVLPKVAGIKLVVKQNKKPLGEFITDASGGFSFEIKAAATGLATYQVVISAGEKNTAAISDEITILVR